MGSYAFYSARIALSKNSNISNGELSVRVWTDANIYTTGFKVVVILISKSINTRGTRFFRKNFFYFSPPNLGVSEYYYGQASTGRSCIHGFYNIRLYFSSYSAYYYFTYNNFAVTQRYAREISSSSYLTTLCLTQCPPATYFDGSSCLNCNASMPNCTECTSASSCVSCPAPQIMNFNSNACECPPRLFLNSSTNLCDSCPFDCWTCDSNGSCLSCSASSDFRQLNGSRCAPLLGYYETNVTMAEPCSENCLICSSSSDCSECAARSVLVSSSSSVSCQVCPFDCLTCDSSGSCLSCSTSDYR